MTKILYKKSKYSSVYLNINKEKSILSVEKKYFNNSVFYKRIIEFYNSSVAKKINKNFVSPIHINKLFNVVKYPFIKGVNIKNINLGDIENNKLENIIYKSFIEISNFHKLGYIHGDLNPSNIIIDKDLEPYFIDCGYFSKNDIKNNIVTIDVNFLAPNRVYLKNPFLIDYYALAKTFINIIDSSNLYYHLLNDIISLKNIDPTYFPKPNYAKNDLSVFVNNAYSDFYFELVKIIYPKNKNQSYSFLVLALQYNKKNVGAVEFLAKHDFVDKNKNKAIIVFSTIIIIIICIVVFKIFYFQKNNEYMPVQRENTVKINSTTTLVKDKNVNLKKLKKTYSSNTKAYVFIDFLKGNDTIFFNEIPVTNKKIKLGTGEYTIYYHGEKRKFRVVPYLKNTVRNF